MNTSFRTVWNEAELGAFVAVCELVGKQNLKSALTCTCLAAISGFFTNPCFAQTFYFYAPGQIRSTPIASGNPLSSGVILVVSSGSAQQAGITGSGIVTKSGAGLLTLTGSSSFTGIYNIQQGTLRASSGSLGSSGARLRLYNSTFQFTSGSYSNSMAILGSLGTFDVAGSSGISVLTSISSLGRARFINSVSNGSQAVSQAVRVTLSNPLSTVALDVGVEGTNGGRMILHSTNLIQGSQGLAATRLFYNSVLQFSGTSAVSSIDLTAIESTNVDATRTGVEFLSGASAGASILTLAAMGSFARFAQTSSAGTATINNQGGLIFAQDTANLSDATVNNTSGTLSITGASTGISIGQLNGGGNVDLGSKTLTVGNLNKENSISGTITGVGGSLIKVGNGSLELSGTNTFTGSTLINAGKLLVNGDQSAVTGSLLAAAGSTLGGSGKIAGVVTIADGAHLAPGNSAGTLSTGTLTLAPFSLVDFELGQASLPGGMFNDLVHVNGNLTLDGTLNITQSSGGTFAPGVYRLFDYTGALVNNTLEFGTAPVPVSSLHLQTSIANQINLVNSNGVNLRLWDGGNTANHGATMIEGNGIVEGGVGTWQGKDGNNNWTGTSGVGNSPWVEGAFALFQGTGGVVNVDGVTYGPVNIEGLQFLSNNYVLSGGFLNATTPTTFIRIGAGAAGADIGTAINSVISDAALVGGSQVIKTDPGTLILGGLNTYRGGTNIREGTLQVDTDANLGHPSGPLMLDGGTLRFANAFTSARNIQINSAGGALDTNGNAVTLSGSLSGTGQLIKTGAGVLSFEGLGNTLAGQTIVHMGVLETKTANSLSANSPHVILPTATLALNGNNQTIASLSNAGTVSLVGSAPGTTLTINGNYVGTGGTLILGTALNTGGVFDKMIIKGSGAVASGSTNISITSLGGLGAATVGNGIELISVEAGATSTKSAFTLNGGHVDAGAFEYHLYSGDAAGQGDSWYLRSDSATGAANAPGIPWGSGFSANPSYRAEVPLFAALPNAIRQGDLAILGNLHQRRGDVGYLEEALTRGESSNYMWSRTFNGHVKAEFSGMVQYKGHSDLTAFQVGADIWKNADWIGGLYFGTARNDTIVNGVYGPINAWGYAGNLRVDSRYLGGYATYSSRGGFYTDLVAQYGRHDVDVSPTSRASAHIGGKSFIVSAEMGQRFNLVEDWAIEPQAQLAYQHLTLDNAALAGSTTVHQNPKEGFIFRIGGRIVGRISTSIGRLDPYARINISHQYGAKNRSTFVGGAGATPIVSEGGYTSSELAAGFTLDLNKRVIIYGELGKLLPIGGTETRMSSSIKGALGISVAF